MSNTSSFQERMTIAYVTISIKPYKMCWFFSPFLLLVLHAGEGKVFSSLCDRHHRLWLDCLLSVYPAFEKEREPREYFWQIDAIRPNKIDSGIIDCIWAKLMIMGWYFQIEIFHSCY